MQGVTIDAAGRRFSIAAGNGYTCLGFDVLYKRLKQIVNYLGLKLPVRERDKGTMAQYSAYMAAVKAAEQAQIKETWFDPDTPVAVKRVLERARKDESTVRIFLGDPDTGRNWMEENDVIGRIGRSGGTFRVPLLLAEGGRWGAPILTACILRIQDARTGEALYSHRNWSTPELEIRTVEQLAEMEETRLCAAALKKEKFTHSVWMKHPGGDWHVLANFRSFAVACKYVAFMTGAAMCQP